MNSRVQLLDLGTGVHCGVHALGCGLAAPGFTLFTRRDGEACLGGGDGHLGVRLYLQRRLHSHGT